MTNIDNRISNIIMNTPGVQGITNNSNNSEGTTGGASFSDYLNNALAGVAGSDYEDKTTNIGLMTGSIDNLHTATIAAEKADIMLNLTVQVRNKVVEGYQEIMRMQM